MPNWCGGRAAMAAAAGKDRNRSRGSPLRRLAGNDPGQPHRPAHSQQGFQDRPDGRPRPAPAGPWRSERLDQVPDLGAGDPGTGQRPGNHRPRGRRGLGQAASRAAGHHGLRLRRRRSASWRFRPSPARSKNNGRAATAASCTRSIPIATIEVAELIDRLQEGRRHAGRHRRDSRRGPALRTRHAYPVGQETRRPPGPGRDGRAGHERRRDRHGFRGRADARLAGPRPDPVRSQPDAYAVARFHPDAQQCRRAGGRA